MRGLCAEHRGVQRLRRTANACMVRVGALLARAVRPRRAGTCALPPRRCTRPRALQTAAATLPAPPMKPRLQGPGVLLPNREEPKGALKGLLLLMDLKMQLGHGQRCREKCDTNQQGLGTLHQGLCV